MAGNSVADLLKALDHGSCPLGPVAAWPAELRQAIALALPAKAQIVLFWGPQYVALYNDAYASAIGDKHPRALGRPASETWPELWDDLEPLLRGVRDTGETFQAKDRPFHLERGEGGETTCFDVSYSAVPGPGGQTDGVLCIVAETTERVRAEARLAANEARLRAVTDSVDQKARSCGSTLAPPLLAI